ncbi:hypothetical protein [Tuwongella immobilis]|nr:hypothetical protein [Tuwongella immobilis]
MRFGIGRRFMRLPTLAANGALLGMLGMLTLLPGCSDKAATVTKATFETTSPDDELLVNLPARIRRDPSADACRNLINQINNSSLAKPDPAIPVDERTAMLAKQFALTENELREIRRPEFTALDAQELSDAILFREAINALEIRKLPLAQQVDELFGWMTRMIRPAERTGIPTPPQFVAIRGSGDGVERAYVFLALLRQLGVTAAIVGPESVATQATYLPPPNPNGRGTVRTPFWAVGVAIDGQLRLYDPFNGEIVRTATGEPATLQILRDKPESVKAWIDSAPQIESKSMDAIRAAGIAFTTSVSSLAPRMQRLEPVLKSLQLQLAARVDEQLAELQKLPGVKAVQPWAPPGDSGTLTHVLAEFLPVEQGGLGESKLGQQSFIEFIRQMVPWGSFPPSLNSMSGPSSLRVRALVMERYQKFILEPNNPHLLLIRGQYDDLIQQMTSLREESGRLGGKNLNDLDAKLAEWGPKLDAADANVARANRAKDIAASQRAQADLEQVIRDGGEVAFMLERWTARLLAEEGTYLLCLCIQEKAEQSRILGVAGANLKDSWSSSKDWWERYLRDYPRQAALYPARIAHAKAMIARCQKMLQP